MTSSWREAIVDPTTTTLEFSAFPKHNNNATQTKRIERPQSKERSRTNIIAPSRHYYLESKSCAKESRVIGRLRSLADCLNDDDESDEAK